MRNSGLVRRTVVAGVIATGALTISLVGPGGLWSAPMTVAGSCFAVADNVVCIEAESVFPMPMPPILIPSGMDDDEVDEDIVIRDDGGRQVARG